VGHEWIVVFAGEVDLALRPSPVHCLNSQRYADPEKMPSSEFAPPTLVKDHGLAGEEPVRRLPVELTVGSQAGPREDHLLRDFQGVVRRSHCWEPFAPTSPVAQRVGILSSWAMSDCSLRIAEPVRTQGNVVAHVRQSPETTHTSYSS